METIFGLVLLAFGCGSYWYLLPRKGQVHPFVRNSDIGSLVTIGLMTAVTAGVGLVIAGLFT